MDLSDPKNPTLATTHQFTSSDGTPRDVAICGDEVAVAVTSGIKDVYEGHVYFFNAFTGGSPGLTPDGKLPGKENRFINKGHWPHAWIQSFFRG